MAAEPCLERAEGDTSQDNAKKDKKKKKERTRHEDGEAGTEGHEQTPDTTDGNIVAGRGEAEGKQSSKSKKSKRKRSDAGEASAGDQAVTREDKKIKKERPAVLESSQKQTFDITAQNLVAENDKAEGKESCKPKKSKHKHNDAVEASFGDQFVTTEDKKRKKQHPVVLEESSQKQTLDATAENLAVKKDEVEGKQSNKSKKSKLKCDNAGEASASDQVVAGEDKKRKKKHSVVLEKSRQHKNTSKGENGEVKERGKEGNESGLEFRENASAVGEEADVDGKNDKKKKKSKEGKREEIKEEGKAARSKNKGKRVSFADSTEVFENEGGDGEGGEGGKKKKKKSAQSKDKGKRVSFADSAEVFSIEGGDVEEGDNNDESKFVHGQRFTPEEDATLMEAIRDFIELKQLGEKGFEMIRSSRQHKELRHCWDVIGKSLPHRPRNAIYCRARVLLTRSEKRKWTQEEKDYIRRYVEQNGTDWMTLARDLGKCNIHVKDTWRRIKSKHLKKGIWTQDEFQKLFDLVNLDLRMKAHQIKNPDNRKLRDNISWEAISDKLSTRNHKNCCMKWYDTLASPMVRKGIWADVDDYLLVDALQKDDAVCVEDVDWDNLLDHRSGEVCRQRWNQMVRGLGGHREKPFIEQVDVLSMRYCPEMIEYRTHKE